MGEEEIGSWELGVGNRGFAVSIPGAGLAGDRGGGASGSRSGAITGGKTCGTSITLACASGLCYFALVILKRKSDTALGSARIAFSTGGAGGASALGYGALQRAMAAGRSAAMVKKRSSLVIEITMAT
jgi:hypothetical protein